jgi:hypothetical protein
MTILNLFFILHHLRWLFTPGRNWRFETGELAGEHIELQKHCHQGKAHEALVAAVHSGDAEPIEKD